eukprot:1159954-Pelagomonas_calceolata.AAC.10
MEEASAMQATSRAWQRPVFRFFQHTFTHLCKQGNLPKVLPNRQQSEHVVVPADDGHAALADDVHLQA